MFWNKPWSFSCRLWEKVPNCEWVAGFFISDSKGDEIIQIPKDAIGNEVRAFILVVALVVSVLQSTSNSNIQFLAYKF